MQKTDFIWMNGSFVKWDEAKIHVLSHSLHYGGGVFEGIRFYKTDSGPAIFRLSDHTERMFYSSGAILLDVPFSHDEINAACIETIRKNGIDQGYIRPLVYFGYGPLGVSTKGKPTEVIIAVWPWGAYLPAEIVDIKTSKYIRIHPKSLVADAKICGHYVNSVLAVQECFDTKYHEALLLDYNGNIAEGPGENFFIVKDGAIHTPQLGTILAGITRNTIIELAKSFGYKVVERDLKLDDAYGADEAFFTGTAAEVTPIGTLDDKVIGDGKVGPVTQKLKDAYLDIVYGRNEKYSHWLTYV